MRTFLLLLALFAQPSQASCIRPAGAVTVLCAGSYIQQASAAAWTPAERTDAIWFRADDLETSGANVTQWNDKGTNGYHATPLSAGFPTLVEDALNGQPAVRFASTNQYMAFANGVNLVNEASAYTVAIVLKAASALGIDDVYGVLGLGAGTNKLQTLYFANFTGYHPVMWGGGKGNPGGNGVGIADFDYSSGFFVLITTYNGDDDFNDELNWTARRNNVAQSPINPPAGTTNTLESKNLIGASTGAGVFPLHADVVEIIIDPGHAWDSTTQANFNSYTYGRYVLGTDPLVWSPSSIENAFAYFQSSNTVRDINGHAARVTDLTNQRRDLDCLKAPPRSDPVPIVDGVLNGQPALRMNGAGAGGPFLEPSQTTVFAGANQPFWLAWVLTAQSLATDAFTALWQMAGPNSAESFTVYYLNIAGYPTFAIMSGAVSCSFIGPAAPFTGYTSPHSVIFAYNGGGDYSNPSNYSLWLNGEPTAVTLHTGEGNNTTLNWIGNQDDPPGVGPGDLFSAIAVKAAITPQDVNNTLSFFNSRYGI